MPNIELQDIRFVQWNDDAKQIGEIIDFFGGGKICAVKYKSLSGIFYIEWWDDLVSFECSLAPGEYLVYSKQSGYRAVTKEIFDSFVKLK